MHGVLLEVWLQTFRLKAEATMNEAREGPAALARGKPPAEPYNRFVTRLVVFSCAAAVVVFAVVQDRLTVSGVGQYVTAYRDAAASGRPAVTIDEVMKPAVAHAVRQGALWGGVVLVAGLAVSLGARRRPIRE
jgi:hypothetical protein